MRIPFFRTRKKVNALHMKGIGSEFTLNRKAQQNLMLLVIGTNDAKNRLDSVFEQIFIIYQLALFIGSHEISDCARNALRKLRDDYIELNKGYGFIMDFTSTMACSKALEMGIPLLQELPRSEFKLAYVHAKGFTESGKILTYLETLS